MICNNCHTENPDDAVFCKGCGERLDGKLVCPVCGSTYEEGAVFCANCGTRLDGKTTCKQCGAVYEGNFCPVCGTPANEEANAPKAVAAPETAPAAKEEKQEQEKQEKQEQEQPEEKPKKSITWKKVLITIGGVLAMLAAALTLIFSMFIGFEVVALPADSSLENFGSAVSGMGAHNIFYYFFENFKDATEMLQTLGEVNSITVFAIYIKALLGTLIAAGTLITVLTLSIKTATRYISYMRNGVDCDFGKCAYGTVLAYIAGIAGLYALEYFSVTMTYSGLDISVGIKMNGTTVAGLVVGSVLIACYLGFCTAVRGKAILRKRTLCELICSAIGIVILVLLTYFSANTCAQFTSGNSTISYGFSNIFYLNGIRSIYDTENNVWLDFLLSLTSFVLLGIIIILAAQEMTERMRAFERNTFITLGHAVAIVILSVIFTVMAVLVTNRFMGEGSEDVTLGYSAIIAVPILAALNLARVITQTILQKSFK